jgi:uncharacterized membrane protein
VGVVMIGGVVISAALLTLGLILTMASSGGTWAGHLLAAGLVILMATPIVRVIISMLECVRMGEWFFVFSTIVVLAELGAGVLYALRR